MDREASKSDFTTIPEYIARFPEHVRDILEELRRVIRETAPEAEGGGNKLGDAYLQASWQPGAFRSI